MIKPNSSAPPMSKSGKIVWWVFTILLVIPGCLAIIKSFFVSAEELAYTIDISNGVIFYSAGFISMFFTILRLRQTRGRLVYWKEWLYVYLSSLIGTTLMFVFVLIKFESSNALYVLGYYLGQLPIYLAIQIPMMTVLWFLVVKCRKLTK